MGFRVWGLGFGVWGLGFRFWGLRIKVNACFADCAWNATRLQTKQAWQNPPEQEVWGLGFMV